jgi:hypothetical protein
VQAGLGNLFAAPLTPAIAAVFDSVDCCFNLVEDAIVTSEQSEREFLIGIVTPKLFHVGRYAGGLAVVLQGIVFHLSLYFPFGRRSDTLRAAIPPMLTKSCVKSQ